MSIPISKEGGLEPHLINCARCGQSAGLTVGVLYEGTDLEGRKHYYNHGQRGAAERSAGVSFDEVRHVEEGERITAGLCTDCETELESHHKIISDGGVAFRCVECQQEGVIKPSAFASHVREAAGIKAPAPCGVEFNKCTEHGKEE